MNTKLRFRVGYDLAKIREISKFQSSTKICFFFRGKNPKRITRVNSSILAISRLNFGNFGIFYHSEFYLILSSINFKNHSKLYGGYSIIKQKLSERDLSREWIGIKTLK